jgi:uncharacterized membrane protein
VADAGPVDGVDGLRGDGTDVVRATARGAAERLVFFSDAVVAIAITLLALELPVPTGETGRELFASLEANGFAYLTFVISFLVVGAHWRAHHAVFRYLAAADGAFLRLDLLWLLGIVTTPFLTEVIREGELGVLRFGLYAAAQAALLLVFAAMRWVARRHDLFLRGTPAGIAHPIWWDELAPPAAFLVSIPLYPLLGAWAFALWAVVPAVSGRVAQRSGAR